jgi:ADP-heptose:LPS heptosyltransferase
MRIEVGVPTKDRYENLALLLWSLCEQNFKDFDITIIDDSENRTDIRELNYMGHILKRLDKNGNQWRVEFGRKKGPHWCHQQIIDGARNPLIYRVDDDCILDRNCLQELVNTYEDLSIKEGVLLHKKIGAVGPIVLDPSVDPNLEYLPLRYQSFKKYQGKVDECGVNFGEHQWRRHPDDELQDVQHLYSSFLYSKEVADKIGGYDLEYDLPGHREETDFTLRLWKTGLRLVVNPKALVWHLRAPQGGIRAFKDNQLWANCQERFIKKFNFRTEKNQEKVFKIFGGLGDHLCATPLIRGLRRKFDKVIVLPVYPYMFSGNPNIDEILFLDEEPGYSNIVNHSIYQECFDAGFAGKLSEAWCKCYGIGYDGDNLDYTIFPQEKEWAKKALPEKSILISTAGAISVIQYVNITATTGAGKRTSIKDWFKEDWEALVKEIHKLGYKVYQVGGDKDDRISGCDGDFLGESYRHTMALLDRCTTWVSIDTFLQHGGHAVGKRGIALFGATKPKMFGHSSNINIYHDVCKNKPCLWEGGDRFQWLHRVDYVCNTKECFKAITCDEILNHLSILLNPA